MNHRLTELVNLAASFTWSQTVPNAPILLPGETENLGTTTNTTVRAIVSAPLSADTTVYGGARYQDADVQPRAEFIQRSGRLPGNSIRVPLTFHVRILL